MTTLKPKKFQTLLFNWFDQHGRKHLPWQQNKTPYRVWVSEIMLQQTQVNTAIPYFEAFLQAFPTLIHLADASQDEVLRLWAGLGYYSRARNLHKAAIKVRDEMNGELPDTIEALQTLPGIGRSTAGAIASIAFNQRATILDGNVKRVLARLHAITQPINEKLIENELWAIAEQYTPSYRVADYTQAIMDLGATFCKRGQPQCLACPYTKHCAAHQQGLAASLPTKKTAGRLPVKSATFLLLQAQGKILIQKRPSKGIWGGLWSFPEIAGKPDNQAIQEFCKEHFQISVTDIELMPAFRHTFSHYHLDIFPVAISLKRISSIAIEAAQQIWYNPSKPSTVGLPKPILSIMRTLSCHD